jgi:hypothetical protein
MRLFCALVIFAIVLGLLVVIRFTNSIMNSQTLKYRIVS